MIRPEPVLIVSPSFSLKICITGKPCLRAFSVFSNFASSSMRIFSRTDPVHHLAPFSAKSNLGLGEQPSDKLRAEIRAVIDKSPVPYIPAESGRHHASPPLYFAKQVPPGLRSSRRLDEIRIDRADARPGVPLSHKNVLPFRIGIKVLLGPPFRLINHFGKNQQWWNRLQMPGLMINQHHGSTAADAKIDQILARPFLRHDLFGQVAPRPPTKSILILG